MEKISVISELKDKEEKQLALFNKASEVENNES